MDEADRALLAYVVQVTEEPTRTTPEDLQRLRELGFGDQAILQMNLIAAWFNYANRVADGLGVGRRPSLAEG